jgi:hypothetical protein
MEWWTKADQARFWRQAIDRNHAAYEEYVMAKQPEGKIKTACRTIALAAGLLFWNIEGKSLNGVPDTLCSRVAGGIMLIEFKVPGKEPTQQQWKRIYELREQGINAWWADSVEMWEMLVGLRERDFDFEYPAEIESWL